MTQKENVVAQQHKIKCNPVIPKRTERPYNLYQRSVSPPFPLKILENISSHLHPHFVNKMKLVLPSLTCSPLVPTVSFEVLLDSINHLLGGPGPHDVEPWHLLDVVLLVEIFYPLINLFNLLPPVDVARGGGAIVGVPNLLFYQTFLSKIFCNQKFFEPKFLT